MFRNLTSGSVNSLVIFICVWDMHWIHFNQFVVFVISTINLAKKYEVYK